MTNEQAIKWLKAYIQDTPFQMEQYERALEMAIQALSQEPCDKCKYFDGNSCQHYDYKVGYTQGYEDASKRFRQEPCDDAVSRQAVIKLFNGNIGSEAALILHKVKQLPPVNPQPSEHFIDGVHAMGYREGYKDAQKQKSGKWIEKDLDNFRKYEVVCSECGSRYIGNYDAYDEPGDFNYCPNCGCRMVEPQESEDKTE